MGITHLWEQGTRFVRVFRQQAGAAKQPSNSPAHCGKVGFHQRFAGNQHQVISSGQVRQPRADGFTQAPFGTIAPHRVAHASPGGHPHAHPMHIIGRNNQHNQRVGVRPTFTPHPLKIRVLPQAKPAIHSIATIPGKRRLGLPVDALDVVVHLDGQAMASLQAAALQHQPTAPRRHAGAEAMPSQATANFGLISPFRHRTPSQRDFSLTADDRHTKPLPILADGASRRDYTATLPFGQSKNKKAGSAEITASHLFPHRAYLLFGAY